MITLVRLCFKCSHFVTLRVTKLWNEFFSFIAKISLGSGIRFFTFFYLRLLQTYCIGHINPVHCWERVTDTTTTTTIVICYFVIDYVEPLFNMICCCVYVDYNMIWILCFQWVNGAPSYIVFTSYDSVGSGRFPTALAPFGWARQAGARRCFISNRVS